VATPLPPHDPAPPRADVMIRSRFFPHGPISRPGGGGAPNPLNALQNPVAGRGNPITPELLVARQSGAVDLNPTYLQAQTWLAIRVDRPVLLIPRDTIQYVVQATTTTQNGDGLIYYAPSRQPTNLGTAGNGDVQKSTRYGVCYLSNPGVWYVYYNRAAQTLGMLVIDASDPNVAARYLSEAGIHGVRFQTFPALAASTNIVAANRDRIAMTVQSTGSAPVRISFVAPATTTSGFRLVSSVGAAITFSGDTNYRGQLWGIEESAGGQILVCEYF